MSFVLGQQYTMYMIWVSVSLSGSLFFLLVKVIHDSSCVSTTQPVHLMYQDNCGYVVCNCQMRLKKTSTSNISIHPTINSDASIVRQFDSTLLKNVEALLCRNS